MKKPKKAIFGAKWFLRGHTRSKKWVQFMNGSKWVFEKRRRKKELCKAKFRHSPKGISFKKGKGKNCQKFYIGPLDLIIQPDAPRISKRRSIVWRNVNIVSEKPSWSFDFAPPPYSWRLVGAMTSTTRSHKAACTLIALMGIYRTMDII